ncbi:restriction endonuclease-like protein [Paenibacillus sp. FSL W8-1187]|uniref:restriction endonuclease-like protein n=1 Tax=Paenibacillus sp. FSL W8-1187 TaxID=2975339 RepID=UPI0030DA2D8A
MDLLPSGSPNRPVELLRICANRFTLYLQGKAFHPTVEKLHLHRRENELWTQANLQVQSLMHGLVIESVQVFDPIRRGMIDWQPGDVCAPIFYETQVYEMIVELVDGEPLTFYHENSSLRESVLPKGSRLLSGVLNFGNEVGYTELELRLHGTSIFRLQLEIFPTKMDYKRDYQAILTEVNSQIYNLSFDFLRKTYQMTGLKETNQQSLTEFWTIIQHLFDQLKRTVERIQASPHYRLRSDHRLVDAARVKRAGRAANMALLTKRSHLLSEQKKGIVSIGDKRYSPHQLLETKRYIDYDTNENRFVRWVLLRLSGKLRALKGLLQRKNSRDPILQGKINRMQTELRRLKQFDFLQVGDLRQMNVTLVLQLAPGYREVYKYYLMLMKGLSIHDDLFRLSMKDLAVLYEYWCFLKIHEILANKYTLIRQDVIKFNRGGLFVTLDKTKAGRMVYRHPHNGEEFTLYYNQLSLGDRSQTISQRPDNVLTLKKRDSNVEYKYVFDAKYRLNPAYEGTSYEQFYKLPGPQEDDINTMHRYRDAIVTESRDEHRQFERTMFGAYVLFPYPNEEEYVNHRFYKSIELVNVGAIPFLPGSTQLMEKFLDELILDSPEKAFERSTRPRGTTEYFQDKFKKENMLIGALSHPDQLEDLKRVGFYHVPLKQFKSHAALGQLEYVGVYQSKRLFGDERSGIHWWGRIVEWQVLPRQEIREIPSRRGASSELYVKLIVEKWQKRNQAILPGGHGVKSTLMTSLYIFERAHEVAELRLESEEQLRLWREERRKGVIHVAWDQHHVDQANQLIRLTHKGT